MLIVEENTGQIPNVEFQLKTFNPKPRPVTVVLGLLGAVITPVPDNNVHDPAPTVIGFPIMV